MSATSYGWLILAFPLAGMLLISLRLARAAGRSRVPGWIASAAILGAFLSSIGALIKLQDRPEDARSLVDSAWTYASTGELPRRHGDPGRPAVGVHVPGRQRRLVPDPRLLDRLHGRRPRLHALLRLPQLLRLLDAAAGAGGQLRAADHRLGVRRRRLLPADLVLVPARDRHARRHQGLRDQRDRRRRPRDRGVPAARQDGLARLRGRLRPGRPGLLAQRRHAGRGLPADPRRRVRQVGAAAAAHLAPGRDGGPHPGLRPDPRRHHGHGRRLPDRAHAPAVRASPRPPPTSARSSARRRSCSRPRSRSQ